MATRGAARQRGTCRILRNEGQFATVNYFTVAQLEPWQPEPRWKATEENDSSDSCTRWSCA